VNVNYYISITYVILFRIYFKDDRQKEVIFISTRSEFPFTVLWVVLIVALIDSEILKEIILISAKIFLIFWRYLNVFSSASLTDYPIAAECFASGYVEQFSRTNICLTLLVMHNTNRINDKLSSRCCL